MYNNNHPTLTERLTALDQGIAVLAEEKTVEAKKAL